MIDLELDYMFLVLETVKQRIVYDPKACHHVDGVVIQMEGLRTKQEQNKCINVANSQFFLPALLCADQ